MARVIIGIGGMLRFECRVEDSPFPHNVRPLNITKKLLIRVTASRRDPVKGASLTFLD